MKGVSFACGNITLEGVWHLPEADTLAPAVIVCHPHPQYGGDMDNSVVYAICQALAEQGIAALRFNFRGVGESGGSYGGGIGEQEDVKCALDYVSSYPNIDPGRLGLAGYSFGAGVAAPVAVRDSRVRLVALVSPALSDDAWQEVKQYPLPKFLISGEHDSIIPVSRFRQHVKEMAGPVESEVVPDADHFWGGYEREIAPNIARFFGDGLAKKTARNTH